jgi:uncharacterized metal-binding protein YceD (DUF177 family)
MNDTPFRILVDRLKDGGELTLSESVTPESLDVSGKELAFEGPIAVDLVAYITDLWLIVDLSIQATAVLSCALCNEPMKYPIRLAHVIHEEALEGIKKGVFDGAHLIREAILLEIPFYPLCGITSCCNREEVKRYLKPASSSELADDARAAEEIGYRPFQDFL